MELELTCAPRSTVTPETHWTLAGDPALEARVAVELALIGDAARRAFGADLLALLIVGGYARGEGGAERRGAELAPHNDYDLLAVTRRALAPARAVARRLSDTWTARLGLHVDITAVPAARLRAPPRTLFWLDVRAGGARVVTGDPAVLAAMPRLTARAVPLEEAGRLLMNRAVGLALSRLAGRREDPVVRARHVHKAMLACGDALLLAADTYPESLAARALALSRIAPAPAVGGALLEAYADAIAFRRDATRWRPRGGDPEAWWQRSLALAGEHHLRFEAFRVGAPQAPTAFLAFRGALFPELPDARPHLAWLSAIRARAAGAASLLPYLGHPRERLARVAVALAYGGADARARAAALLGVRASAGDALLIDKLRALSARGS